MPDIVTVAEAGRLFTMTHTLSYRVLFFTLYSLGLRLGEGLRLIVADIDAERLAGTYPRCQGQQRSFGAVAGSDINLPAPLLAGASQAGVAVSQSPRRP